jgi:hypothetical protein
MRWLPEHGVGIVALGNLTYTSWGRVADEALDVLARTGALQARVPQPSPALLDAQAGVVRLMSAWDDALANSIAADNLFLDEPKDRRRAAVEALAQRHGACTPDGAIVAENALRGEWKLRCDRGHIWVRITLAPTMPPKVQSLGWTSAMPLSAEMTKAVALITRHIGRPGESLTKDVLGPEENATAVSTTLTSAGRWGTCSPGEVLSGDGERSATLSLSCTKGELRMTLGLDTQDRISRLRLAPAPGGCPE